jgi:hypothetical protein
LTLDARKSRSDVLLQFFCRSETSSLRSKNFISFLLVDKKFRKEVKTVTIQKHLFAVCVPVQGIVFCKKKKKYAESYFFRGHFMEIFRGVFPRKTHFP